jgi:insulin-like growth factor-binding protein complex acid labile subunit
LIDLDIDGNKLSTLIFLSNDTNQIGIRELDVSRNQLESLDAHVFDNLPALTRIEAGNNLIAVVETLRLPKLISLDLKNNQISHLQPGTLHSLPNLQKLDLSGNNLKKLPNYMFLENTKLDTLDLRSNYLASLDQETFSGATMLKALYLQNNLLNTIGVSVLWPLQKLQVLDLGNNMLRELHADNFLRSTSLNELYVLFISRANCFVMACTQLILMICVFLVIWGKTTSYLCLPICWALCS